MARIGLDLDGVTYRFVEALRLYIHQTTGRPLEEMEPAQTWDFFKHQWGYTSAEYIEFVKQGVSDGKIFWQGDLFENAKESIDYLYHERGDDIIFITSRSFPGVENLCKHATQYWLNNQAELPFDEIIYADKKYGYQLDVLFDDAPHIIEDVGSHGEKVVVFDQPWNAHLIYPDRVYGWKGVMEYVESHFPRVRNTTVKQIG
jgi:5'-nucleotidase